jgi:adenine-specific DNA-methyltransferase
VDFDDPYLRDQLIAYIGNKRALLPFLHGVISKLPLDPRRSTFLDPFAGSGAVSRLARAAGFLVRANDWEPYSFLINSCHLRLRPSDLPALFPRRGGIAALVDELNSLPPPPTGLGYISRHYAPRDTERADWRTERLFYTRENAVRIDAIRQRIEELCPEATLAKAALIAPLLHEAATHTNTSGVFKACHKGFGGHGGDALHRIMGEVRMRPPVLFEAPATAEVAAMDAAAFLSPRPAEVCYLDPPYSIHQYGSNYFMLNSIALWDRPPVSGERSSDGRLTHKAGIRPDWTRTRSAFCYRGSAAAAMREVLRAADCRWLVVSYSNEGLIGLEELCDLLAERGELSVQAQGYGKYPGGKQGLHRTTRNVELALVVRRGGRSRVSPRVRAALRGVRIARLMTLSFDPARVRRAFPRDGDSVRAGDSPSTLLPMRHFWRFGPGSAAPRFSSDSRARAFEEALQRCALPDVRAEIDVVVSLAARVGEKAERERLLREALRLVNKLAHRKYRAVFDETVGMLRHAIPRFESNGSFRTGLDAVERKARRRLAAAPS